MTEFILDLSNYKDRVGARVEEGRYRVRVDDAEMDKSKAGNQMINLWLTIQGGEFDGLTLTDRLTLTERSLFRVVGFMQAIGLPTPKKRLKLDLRHFIGKTLDVDVEDGEPYNGRVKSEVRGYIKVTSRTASAAPDVSDLDDISSEPVQEAVEAPQSAAPETEVSTSPEPASTPETAPEEVKVAAVPASVPSDIPETIDLDSLDLG